MSIKIKIGNEEGDIQQFSPSIKISLNVRKTLDDNLIIADHPDIDIVVMAKDKKVVAFPKDTYSDDIYDTQDRLFNYLSKKGVVEYGSTQGGNVAHALEASIPKSDYNEIQHLLLVLSKFMEEERPYFEFEKQFEEDMEERLTAPDEEESTEWDPRRFHDEKKGTRADFGHGYYGQSGIYEE
jgi:hypothetical protein